MPILEILFRGLQAGIDHIHILLGRFDATLGLLLEAMQNIDPSGELDRVDSTVAARVKVVVASVMQPTVEYRDQPNASL